MVFPNFTLPTPGGESVSLWDFRQRRPVVLFFCGKPDNLPENLREYFPRYRSLGAEVLAIVSEHPSEEPMPFRILLDENGVVTERLSKKVPSVALLDRFGELRARWEAPWKDGPEHEEILEELVFVESECPECGVSEWPRAGS